MYMTAIPRFVDAVESDPIEKGTVMRNRHDRSLIRLQCRLELLDGREIEMAGWFVQHQQIRTVRCHAGELESDTLSGAQTSELLENLIAREMELGEQVAHIS